MNKKLALFTVFFVVLIDLMGFGIVLPLLPFYASEFHASAVMVGLLYSVYSFAQLIFSPIWGGFSDRVGRRPIMLLSTLGSCLSYVLFALSHSLPVLLLSRLLAGVMGGNISTAQAYVADVTTHEERAKGMGLIGAAFGIGFVFGPAISAVLIHSGVPAFFGKMGWDGLAGFAEQNKYAIPGLFAAFLSAISFLFVLTKLPETLNLSQAADTERIARMSIFTKRFWQSVFKENQGPLLSILLASLLFISIGHSTLYSAFPLFCGQRLGLTPEKVGRQFAYMGVIAVLIQGGLIRVLEKKFGEKKLFVAGNGLMALGIALIPLATHSHWLWLYLAVLAIGGSLNGPTLNSLISKQSSPSKIGQTMGTAQGVSALGRVIGPTWGGLLFGIGFRLPFMATAFLVAATAFAGLALKD